MECAARKNRVTPLCERIAQGLSESIFRIDGGSKTPAFPAGTCVAPVLSAEDPMDFRLARRFAPAIAALALVSTPAASAPNLDPRLGIAEGFRNPSVMADISAGWERLVLPWDQVQPSGPG